MVTRRTGAGRPGRRAQAARQGGGLRISILEPVELHLGDMRHSVSNCPRRQARHALMRRFWATVSMAVAVLMTCTVASAQDESATCGEEWNRTLGITQVEIAGEATLRSVCPNGNLELLDLTATVGARTALEFEFQQLAFDQAIYHLDLRDADQRPVDWITATPVAGEIDGLTSARIELLIEPPVDLVSTVQSISVGVTLHDGEKSWSRDLRLQITVADEQPLFRDQFEIDPVIGQFSQRSEPTRRLRLIAAQPHGGR